ncbi:MAG TPA: M56 family metallopeptidase, partial [Longimicrobium sp.]
MIDTGSIGRVADGTAAWLLTYAVHSTVLLGVAWLVSRAHVGEQVRETLWKLALAGALLTASIAQLRPGAAAVRITPAPTGTEIVQPARPAIDAPAGFDGRETVVSPVSVAAAARRASVPWTRVVVLVWLAGAVAALARLAAGWMRFTRRLARVPAAPGEPASVALRQICDAAGVRRPIRLTWSKGLAAPVALPGGEICVPHAMAARLDVEQQRAMLAHETAHLLRGDPLWLWAASVMAGVFWFQPLLRACLRGLRDAAEYQCDAWAAERTGAFALARCLADVAAWSSPRHTPAPAAAMAAGGATLVRRVERLLHGAAEPRARRRWTVAGVLALALAAAYIPAISTETAA